MLGKDVDKNVSSFADFNDMSVKVVKGSTEFCVSANPRYANFWANSYPSAWELETFKIIDRFVGKDKIYIDIGTWVGPTLLYAANKAKYVYGMEPDKVSFNEVMKNLSFNPALADKVTIKNQALYNSNQILNLNFDETQSGDSISSLITPGKNSYEVDGISFGSFCSQNSINAADISLIKIDIEGAEFVALEGVVDFFKNTKVKPVLYLSTHKGFLIKNLKARYRKYRLLKGILSRRVAKNEITKFCQKLSAYNYCYDEQGKAVPDMLKKVYNKSFTSIVLTDEPWNS